MQFALLAQCAVRCSTYRELPDVTPAAPGRLRLHVIPAEAEAPAARVVVKLKSISRLRVGHAIPRPRVQLIVQTICSHAKVIAVFGDCRCAIKRNRLACASQSTACRSTCTPGRCRSRHSRCPRRLRSQTHCYQQGCGRGTPPSAHLQLMLTMMLMLMLMMIMYLRQQSQECLSTPVLVCSCCVPCSSRSRTGTHNCRFHLHRCPRSRKPHLRSHQH